ncbi:sensor histidine kinase [Alicyclobacillus fastidiosus]|uniref:histidine kinase n=1 Tax=Alicyclobacillus fastidiosus TaxID=392011 RepID=A0ABV5ACJ5_9BACL|nr:ATP-binding protein [Alicyclobacillus fastidiosus]WEH10473.1 ATP-binding protein [Alicyclobacillus fastidiosus]
MRWVGRLNLRALFAPRSLRYQLLSRSLLILSGLLLFIGALQYVFMSHFLFQNTAQNLRNQVNAVPPEMWTSTMTGPDREQNGHPPLGFMNPDTTVSFIDQSGNIYVYPNESSELSVLKLPESEYQAALAYGERNKQYQLMTDKSGVKEMVVLTPVGRPDQPVGVVQVTTAVRPLQQILGNQLIIFICLALGALLAGVFTFIPTLRRTLVPLSEMSDTVARVNAGNMNERVSLTRPQTEIDLLAGSFNAMLERLSSAFESEREAKEKMRQFVADASHELRTPLTSIRGFVEILLRGAANQPAQLDMALRSMLIETERLSRLVQDLLTLAKLDRDMTFDMQPHDLDGVIGEMEPQLRLLAGTRHVEFQLDGNISVRCDKDRMKQVVLNLFQNAVDHTDPTAGRITVSLVQLADGARLAVSDNGPGVSEEHQLQLFERFYRIDAARTRAQGGAGLGLAITKSIVERHHGTITCESELGHGTSFAVWLPH